MRKVTVTPFQYEDEELAALPARGGALIVLRGIGSGLSKGPCGRIWAIGDRGPNLKVDRAIERLGLAHLEDASFAPGAKVMPLPDIGPALSELVIREDRVDRVQTFAIRTPDGRPITGLPPRGTDHCQVEPALDMNGTVLPADVNGADTEGLVALGDGGFWVGDEYGPSLLRVAADGTILVRWVPEGSEPAFADASYTVLGVLPAIAAKRQLNRGFEALGISPSQQVLYLAFQSPLAHPDEAAHKAGRWVRVWTLDASNGALLAEFAYPLDEPSSFRRDMAAGEFGWPDLKVSELTVLGENRLLLLERGSHTTKLYAVTLTAHERLEARLAELTTRPTLEELSATGTPIPLLSKELLLSTDDHPEIGPDLEGMVLLSPQSLLLVNDNDFGVEGVTTRFWRVDLDTPI